MAHLYSVDVETTGLDPKTCSIVSIGAVDLQNNDNVFYQECRVFDGAEIAEQALKINGFSMEEVLDLNKQTEAEAIFKFFNWLKESPIMVAHNAAFDSSFIRQAALRAGAKNPFSFRTIDIHSLAYMGMLQKSLIIPKSLSLNAALEAFGFDKEPTPHNALTGAKCNTRLFNQIRRS